MRETKFLQMCLFSIILNSLHSLNLSFPLLFYVISTTVLTFYLNSLHRYHDSPHFLLFHPVSSHSHADFSNRILISLFAF